MTNKKPQFTGRLYCLARKMRNGRYHVCWHDVSSEKKQMMRKLCELQKQDSWWLYGVTVQRLLP